MLPRNDAAPDGGNVEGSSDEVRGRGATSGSILPDHTPSPSCDAAACVLANLATSDLLARYRVSAASRDVCDAMVSTGLLDRVRESIGAPVTPDDWIAFYEKRADELAAKLDARRRAREAGVAS